jgi:hypothetical protein
MPRETRVPTSPEKGSKPFLTRTHGKRVLSGLEMASRVSVSSPFRYLLK